MKKFAMDPTTLEVQSFPVATTEAIRGTIRAAGATDTPDFTCFETCFTCELKCDLPPPATYTCAFTLCGSFTCKDC